MNITVSLIQALFTILSFLSILYYLVCIFSARRFFGSPPPALRPDRPPVSVLIPLCGVDFEAYHNYASFCVQEYPDYQMVFGVRDPQDSSIPVVKKLMEAFPERDIELVVNDAVIGENPKVSNLFNMLATAKHERILIADSDIRVGPDFLSTVIPHLNDDKVGLVTCFYRGGNCLNLATCTEFIGISAEFAPGVLVARMTEGMSFALGATMATTKQKLESIGGFRAIADYLADDYMIGHLLWKAGFEIRLAPYVVETMQSAVSFTKMMKHQIRWSRGIRACRPAGHLGSFITHGTVIALISAFVHSWSPASTIVLGLTFATRFAMGWYVGVRCLGDQTLRTRPWLLPVRDILGFVVWCSSLAGRRVEWREKPYKIVGDGRIIPIA
jgi:ceramide glucosyltransferase